LQQSFSRLRGLFLDKRKTFRWKNIICSDMQVASPDIVVPTLDTVRHESLLYTWLAEHKPMGEYLVSATCSIL
jgi:hypothetical protein